MNISGSKRAEAVRAAEFQAEAHRKCARMWLGFARSCWSRSDRHKRNLYADRAREALRASAAWADEAVALRTTGHRRARSRPLPYA